MTASTNLLLTAALAGSTVDLYPNGVALPDNQRTQVAVNVSFSAGTGTIKLYGKNEPADDWIEVGSYTADSVALVTKFKRMRAATTAQSGLTARLTLGENGKPISDTGSGLDLQ